MVQINESEIDGVRVCWAEAPPPAIACLAFRVGRVDEDLTRTGYTHLVEHLAISRIHADHPATNGAVTHNLVRFAASGTDLDAGRFLSDCCDAITNLPIERLEAELRILRTEARSRSPRSHGDMLLHLRYGARTFGLVGVEELALERADSFEEDLEDWKRTYFTRGNACVWMTIPPPEDLRMDLPAGDRMRVPNAEPVIVRLPAYLEVRPCHWVLLGATAERSVGLVMALSVLDKRARNRLRHDAGLTYQTGVLYDPLDATTVHAVMGCDTLPDHAQEVQDILLDVILDLRREGPARDELDEVVREYREALAAPMAAPGVLDGVIHDYLLRGERRDEDVASMMESTTPEDAANAAEALMTQCLMIGPLQPIKKSRKFKPWLLEVGDPPPTTGEIFKPTVTWSEGNSLVVGSTAVTMRGPDTITIGYDDIEALVQDGTGTRQIWSKTGTRILIRPQDWKNGPRAIDAIERHIPDDKRLLIRHDLVGTPEKPDEEGIVRIADVAPSRLRRAISAAIDVAIIYAVLVTVLGAEFVLNVGRSGFDFTVREALVGLLIPFAYDFTLTIANGRTVGKLVTGTRVVQYGPRRPSAARLLLRSAIKTAYFLTSFIMVLGVIAFLMSDARQGWHDRGSRTFVVDERWWQENAPAESSAMSGPS